MKLRKTALAATTLTIAATAVLTGAGIASADGPPSGGTWDHVWSSGDGATVYVEEHGDLISVCDTKANGHSAHVHVTLADGPYRYFATVGGKGSCSVHSASQGGKYNLPEGKTIRLLFNGDNGGQQTEKTFVNDH